MKRKRSPTAAEGSPLSLVAKGADHGVGAGDQHPAWRYSMVCSSNMNRSMEAHGVLERAGFANVTSYGVGSCVRLPHRTNPKGNSFDFGTPYRAIKENME